MIMRPILLRYDWWNGVIRNKVMGAVQDKYGSGLGPVQDKYRTDPGPVLDKYRTSLGPVSDKYRTGLGPIQDKYITGPVNAKGMTSMILY